MVLHPQNLGIPAIRPIRARVSITFSRRQSHKKPTLPSPRIPQEATKDSWLHSVACYFAASLLSGLTSENYSLSVSQYLFVLRGKTSNFVYFALLSRSGCRILIEDFRTQPRYCYEIKVVIRGIAKTLNHPVWKNWNQYAIMTCKFFVIWKTFDFCGLWT